MPTYCFTSDDGETIEEHHSAKSIPKRVRRDGKTYKRDLLAELNGVNTTPPSCYPMYSESMGVGPNPKHIAKARAHGQPVDDKGRAIITSAENRRWWCKKLGMIDAN